MSFEAGQTLAGRFRLVRPVGQGAQAHVWLAEHLALGTQVAVKLIDAELAKQEDARERFKREATAAAQLKSPHVVQILDHGIDGAQPFIVMELLEGQDLFDRLADRERLTLEETAKILGQVCKALAKAHAAGIVHRDLKPENVFLCSGDDEETVKVLDFGVAKVIDPAKSTMQRTGVGTLIGTPHFMSPEQVKGIASVDFKSDIWALGVIAYRCVTGRLPFDSEGVGDLLIQIAVGDAPIPSKIQPDLPKAFDVWFAKACHRDPAKRFESAKELSDALTKVLSAPRPAPQRAAAARPEHESIGELDLGKIPAAPALPKIASGPKSSAGKSIASAWALGKGLGKPAEKGKAAEAERESSGELQVDFDEFDEQALQRRSSDDLAAAIPLSSRKPHAPADPKVAAPPAPAPPAPPAEVAAPLRPSHPPLPLRQRRAPRSERPAAAPVAAAPVVAAPVPAGVAPRGHSTVGGVSRPPPSLESPRRTALAWVLGVGLLGAAGVVGWLVLRSQSVNAPVPETTQQPRAAAEPPPPVVIDAPAVATTATPKPGTKPPPGPARPGKAHGSAAASASAKAKPEASGAAAPPPEEPPQPPPAPPAPEPAPE